MNERVVYALFLAVVKRKICVSFKTFIKASAEREMAACVFVEQRVVKSDARVSDGRVVRHERAFAKICRAFVHRNHGAQQILVLFRTDVNDFSVLESHAEILDKLPAIRQRSCCDNCSVGVAAHGRREHFLAWNIRVVFDSFKRVFFAAKEVAAVDKPHSEIGAV